MSICKIFPRFYPRLGRDSAGNGAEYVLTVEHPDVLGLDRSHLPDRPDQLDVIGLGRRREGNHPRFLGETVSFAVVARRARRQDVVPRVLAAARQRNHVVPGQELAPTQLGTRPAAVLARVTVAGEEERVGDLTAELAGNVDVADEADDEWRRQLLAL